MGRLDRGHHDPPGLRRPQVGAHRHAGQQFVQRIRPLGDERPGRHEHHRPHPRGGRLAHRGDADAGLARSRHRLDDARAVCVAPCGERLGLPGAEGDAGVGFRSSRAGAGLRSGAHKNQVGGPRHAGTRHHEIAHATVLSAHARAPAPPSSDVPRNSVEVPTDTIAGRARTRRPGRGAGGRARGSPRPAERLAGRESRPRSVRRARRSAGGAAGATGVPPVRGRHLDPEMAELVHEGSPAREGPA